MGGIRKWTKAHRMIATLVVVAAVWGVGITLFVSLGHPLGEVLCTGAMGAVYTAALWYVQGTQ
jgi:1,4-dihydroxy-2-naphthoate octaprenyltransferase